MSVYNQPKLDDQVPRKANDVVCRVNLCEQDREGPIEGALLSESFV